MTRELLPQRRYGETRSFTVGQMAYTANLGRYQDGRLGELFLRAGKAGTDVAVASQETAIAASFALQFGADFETLRAAMPRDAQGKPEGPLGILFDMLDEGGA